MKIIKSVNRGLPVSLLPGMMHKGRSPFKRFSEQCDKKSVQSAGPIPLPGLFNDAGRIFLNAVILSLLLIFIPSCKQKEVFVDPVYIFLKWSSAVKNLNYKEYSECEAFPKDDLVFRELFGDYYFSELQISEIGKYNENEIKSDAEGYKYHLRKVYFECKRVERKTSRIVQEMKGDVEFVNYINGPNINRGWLMYNRTFIATGIKLKK